MITFTLKGIPKGTHRELKKRAAVNRRSLNNEIIFTLETLLGSAPRKAVQLPQSRKPAPKTPSRK